MMTKDELLEKGIPEEVADEIIASSDTSEDESNPLQALKKAIDDDDPAQENLFKAQNGEDDDDDGDSGDTDEYDEEYMKKNMKRYMKENKKQAGKIAKEVGLFEEKMKKAIDSIDTDAEGAVVEMSDLSEYLDSQGEINAELCKAISTLANEISVISSREDKMYDLMQKAARVQVETANSMGDFLSQPQGRKGVVAAPMTKATPGVPENTKITPEQNKAIYSKLWKAVESGDDKAGYVISAMESAGKDANKLNQSQKRYIDDLLKQEEK